MVSIPYDKLVVCPHCGNETPNYADCVLCGYSMEEPDAPPRDVSEDEIQQMMAEAKLEEIRAKRGALYGDAWDHAPWLERLQTLAQIAPQNAKVHYYIGAAETELGQHRQAIVSYTRALVNDPALADALRRRGDAQYLLVPVLSGDVEAYYERALADYEAAIELDPDAYTYNAHGALIASLGRVEEALGEYDRAAELEPDYPETYFNRGYAHQVRGETAQAIADFERFLSFEAHWNEDMVAQARSHIKEMTEDD